MQKNFIIVPGQIAIQKSICGILYLDLIRFRKLMTTCWIIRTSSMVLLERRISLISLHNASGSSDNGHTFLTFEELRSERASRPREM
jgi:hypothetical protein